MRKKHLRSNFQIYKKVLRLRKKPSKTNWRLITLSLILLGVLLGSVAYVASTDSLGDIRSEAMRLSGAGGGGRLGSSPNKAKTSSKAKVKPKSNPIIKPILKPTIKPVKQQKKSCFTEGETNASGQKCVCSGACDMNNPPSLSGECQCVFR